MLTLTLHEIIPGTAYCRFIFRDADGQPHIWRTKKARAESLDLEVGKTYRIACHAVPGTNETYISWVKTITEQRQQSGNSCAVNCIRMITLLQSNFYSSTHLAEVLGVDQRSVRYYRLALLDAGIDIRSVFGPKGGYYIPQKTTTCPHCGKDHEV